MMWMTCRGCDLQPPAVSSPARRDSTSERRATDRLLWLIVSFVLILGYIGGVNPAAQVNATVVDAKGRTVKVWNADNVPTFTSTLGATTTAPSIAFDLDGFGRMRTTTLKGQAATITATYDALGRQATLDDPDKGAWSYVNSALGYVLQQTDARGTVTQTTYDALGRPLGRTTQRAGKKGQIMGGLPPLERTRIKRLWLM
jgi:YD repeat-containing protein